MSIEKLDFQKVTQENKGFTTHLNIVLQNVRDPLALGIWCYLSSLSPNWKVNKIQLRSHFYIGREKLDKALSLLKRLKLIQFIRERNPNGTIEGSTMLVMAGHTFNHDTGFQCYGSEPHIECGSNHNTGLPDSGLPVTGKQPLKNKQIQKKEKTKKRENISLSDFIKSNPEAIEETIDSFSTLTDQERLNEWKKFTVNFECETFNNYEWLKKLKTWLIRSYEYKLNKRR